MIAQTAHLYWTGFAAIGGGIGGLSLLAWATDFFRRPYEVVEQVREVEPFEPLEVDSAPVDPVSIEATRPVDVNYCVSCAGEGVVHVHVGSPFLDEWDDEECRDCGGTGLRGAA